MEGKNGARRADRFFLVGREGSPAELFYRDTESRGRVLQEPTGPGGAFVVHHEIDRTPVITDLDDFAVLPADVDQRARAPKIAKDTPRMASDLGQVPCCVLDQLATVSSGDCWHFTVYAKLGASGLQHPLHLDLDAWLGLLETRADDRATAIDRDELAGSGAGIDADGGDTTHARASIISTNASSRVLPCSSE
jgi:hypothetical protein